MKNTKIFYIRIKLIKPVSPQAAELGIFINFIPSFHSDAPPLRDLIKDTLWFIMKEKSAKKESK